MGMKKSDESGSGALFAVRSPQDLFAGLSILLISTIVLWGLSQITTMRFASISPTLFPRICAYALAIGGVLLLIRAFTVSGPKIEPTPLRGPVLVTLAVVIFGFLTPIAGYAVAGFLTVVIGGLGSTESRLRELLLLATGLVVLCVLLFTFGLGLPVPPFILPSFTD
jgi:hypothetical protein